MVQSISTGTFCEAKWVVSATAGQGTHTTIASAIAAASAGDTIFIRPGTYTENPTLSTAINLAAYGGNGLDQTVNITGTVTVSHAGTSSITGIYLQTNSANCLSVTGACVLYVEQCYINVTNNDGMSINNASCAVYFENCFGATANTFKFFSITTTAGVEFQGCRLGSAGTTAASTIAAGTVSFKSSIVGIGVSCSGASYPIYLNCELIPFTNTTAITITGTSIAGFISNCHIATGTASCISIGAGVTFTVTSCTLVSSNAAVITGAGTLVDGGLVFAGSSSTINTSGRTPIAASVPEGGTGASTFTAYSVICAGTAATGAFQNVSGVGTSGQVLTSQGAGALPAWGTGAAGGFTWVDSTGATQTIAVNTSYLSDRAGAIAFTLPASATIGDIFRIVGVQGSWTLAQAANQQIKYGSSATTVGVTGSLASTNAGDCIECVATNTSASTVWRVFTSIGNITVA